jgi:hypothetical protein
MKRSQSIVLLSVLTLTFRFGRHHGLRSPHGSDGVSGQLAQPNDQKTDGRWRRAPARDVVREREPRRTRLGGRGDGRYA